MRKLVVALLAVGLMVGPAFAHPGGTDGRGGHTDRSTGEYHYHHGYSAHDHVDGVCPYDYDDRTGESSGSSGSKSSYSYTPVAVAEDWYDEYCDAQEARRAAEKELEEIKSNQLRNLALSAVVGLCGGLSTLIVQIRRSHKRLEETQRRLLADAERTAQWQEKRILAEWEAKLKEEQKARERLISEQAEVVEGRREIQLICLESAREALRELMEPLTEREIKSIVEFAESSYEEAMTAYVEPDVSEGVVYIQKNLLNKEYHYAPNCGSLDGAILVSKIAARRLGFLECRKCSHVKSPETDYAVEVSDRTFSTYHEIASTCLKSQTKIIKLSEAQKRGLKPCSKCKPPKENPKVWF